MADRFLSIAAHPDDLDFGAAGTTATLTAAGHEVVYCLVTNGDAGGFDHTISRTQMAEIRQEEQRAAAKVVGVEELHYLGFPDGAVVANLDLRREISRVIRLVRPDKIITQSAIRNYDRIYVSHPDHLATGEASLSAVYPDARNQFAFPELLGEQGLEPHVVGEVWVMGESNWNHYVDITDTIDLKIEALLCHASQMQAPEEMPDRIRAWALDTAAKAGLPDGRMAEAFRTIDTA